MLSSPGTKKTFDSSTLALMLAAHGDVLMSDHIQVATAQFLAVLAPRDQLKRQAAHGVIEPSMRDFQNFSQAAFRKYEELFELEPKHSIMVSYPNLVVHPMASGLVELWYTWFWIPLPPLSEQHEARIDPMWVEEL
jgi:hypothetical protein